MLTLSDPIASLHHIGKATEPKLKRLGITTVGDLMLYLPTRYEDLSRIKKISELVPDELQTVRARIELMHTKRSFRKRMIITEMQITDDSGTMRAVWFRQPYVGKTLKNGEEILFAGKPKKTLIGMEFTNPVYEKIKDEQLHTAVIVPFYQLTQGITHKQLRFLIKTALDSVDSIPDELPDQIIAQDRLLARSQAVHTVHWPQNQASLDRAIERLKFEELFWRQLGFAYQKKLYEQNKAPAITFKESEVKKFVDNLPYVLTLDQKKSAWRIIQDLDSEKPMSRLLQGDVGSGKTVVAGIAMLNAVFQDLQTALMAPTEILAVQHYATLKKLLPKTQIALHTGAHHELNSEKIPATKLISGLHDGSIEIVVGTHSLIQRSITFKNLGLVVIDEQHRFGVEQRQKLTQISISGLTPHLLSLSATPIPRSLALALYGDLAVSTIREKPAGRKPIITRLISEEKRNEAYQFMREKIAAGQQVFVICPLIDESDLLETKSVLQETERLHTEVFPDLAIRYMHGKLKADEKKRILEDFLQNKFQILVTTSVIEVGIDIPNATVMLIEGAERFGLAQLHQFRGRVGRSDLQSYCLLFSSAKNITSSERLRLLCATNDGLALAEADLKLRGEGEVFGTRQSGIAAFKIATIHDTDLIERSHAWVEKIVSEDADLSFYKKHQGRIGAFGTVHWE